MRGRSYSPSPPRGYGRRGRSPSPRGGRYGARSRDDPTTLLVRNLRHDCRPEDLKKPFGQIGPVKDIYLPRDYYTREPRGFGFIQYLDPADAAEAKYQMDGQVFQGRQLTVVFAEENRKKPTEMRARERGSGGRGGRNYDRRGSPPRYHNSPRYSRSPPPRGRDYYSPPKRRQYSRSVSPDEKRYCRERSYSPRGGQGRTHSQSPPREQSPPYNGSRSRSQSPVREHSPPYNGSRSRSRSPVRAHSPVRGHSRRRNYVKSYTLSPKDNSFTVQLTHPCYVQFQDQLVYYEKEIKGKLSYGEVSDVSGIQVKKVFIWVSVTGINVDEESHIIEFHVGFLSEKLPAKEFENIPTCKNKGCQDSPLASI